VPLTRNPRCVRYPTFLASGASDCCALMPHALHGNGETQIGDLMDLDFTGKVH